MGAAHRAVAARLNLEVAKTHLKGIVGKQPANEWLADSSDELERLGGLNRPEHPWQYTQYAGFGAARGGFNRRLRKGAAITRAAARHIAEGLVFKAIDGRRDQ